MKKDEIIEIVLVALGGMDMKGVGPDSVAPWMRCTDPGPVRAPFTLFSQPGDTISQNNDINSTQIAPFYVGETEAVISSVWRADLCRIRTIPSVPESCKNHPVKRRPYSHSGTGDTGRKSCRTLLMGPDHALYRSFYVVDICSLFVSDIWLPGFSDGEEITGGVGS
jgi:hypothetical protein